MDHVRVLKQAWRLLWHNRALWVFGIVLALTTASWETSLWRGNNGNRSNNQPPSNWQLPPDWPSVPDIGAGLAPQVRDTLIAVGIGLACVVAVLIVVAAVARYVSETALIRMVNQHEDTGEPLTVRQGFRLGWSRTAWRLWLIDLLIDLPAAFAALLLLLVALAPLLLWTTKNTTAGVIGTVAAIGLGFLVMLVIIVAAVALNLVKLFARRACALEGLGVTASVRRGYAMLRRSLKDVGVMWLIVAGVHIGWPIAIAPVVILLIAVGVLLGGGLLLAVRGLTGLALSETAAWIVAGVAGGVLFILALAVPLTFLDGLKETFLSSTWTLTYRELRALRDPSGLEAAPTAV
jgi:hypothetical protein